jgi:hypothetical protein
MIQLLQGDCLEIMPTLPAGSVDLVLCDLPYGITQNKWDVVIPFAPLWAEYGRLCPGPVVLNAGQPFTSALVMSNRAAFRYAWVWNKSHASGVLNAKSKPLLRHEDILVFCGAGLPRYTPQMTPCEPRRIWKGKKTGREGVNSTNYGSTGIFPTTDLYFASGARCKSIHQTQKPVALMEYLIRTYTNPGDTVLDNCMGSGTTGVACVNTGRNFIGIEKDTNYFAIAQERILGQVPAALEWNQPSLPIF